MGSRSWGSQAVLIFCNVVLGISVLLFAKGFFPHKAVLAGLATWPGDDVSIKEGPFDRVIFMVVDALRSDFVYGNTSNFHFTQSLIRSGAAIPFTGHASPPTITMPRVKAITTGSVPSFIDLILNFAESDTTSTLANQDSWLAQLKAKPNGKLVMYGDDTWLRLFPEFFYRSDGTTSFFVSDFTEVDNNVTRHVPNELQNSDWNALIMHYLGLDHIGHKTGPRGPNMPGKQKEMDGIVEQVYLAMQTMPHLDSALLVLLGDHGMNEAGNHGANSAGEVSTALTFVSPRFKNMFAGKPSPAPYADDFRYYSGVDQSDLAPTLAALLGFPIPKNSLGAIIPEILDMWPNKTDQYQLLYQNARQMYEIALATYPDAFETIKSPAQCTDKSKLTDTEKLACQWATIQEFHRSLLSNEYKIMRNGTRLLRLFLKGAQEQLSGTASQYNLELMGSASLLLLLTIVGPGCFGLMRSLNSDPFNLVTFIFTTVMYAITMFASSYVEEEHQFWFWISGAWFVTLLVKSLRVSTASSSYNNAIVCILFGIARRWNQTGQKYAGEPDLVTEVLRPYPTLLWVLIASTYVILSSRLRKRVAELGGKQLGLLPVMVTASALLFKIAFTAAEAPELLEGVLIMRPAVSFVQGYSLVRLARVVFIGLANSTAAIFYLEKPWYGRQRRIAFLETLHDVVSLFLLTQTRTVNIPLLLIYHIQIQSLRNSRSINPFEALLTMLFMQYSSFFAFGGTNAISSVDLSNAYNGVAGYNIVAVGILTFVSNWIGPVYWASATALVLAKSIQKQRFNYHGVLTVFMMVHALAVMVACLILREHLFIWTVFSPKALFMMSWVGAQHMIVNGIFGGTL